METIAAALLKKRLLVLLVFLALIVLSVLAIPQVRVNYDLARYLPEDSMTKQAISVLEAEFGYPGMADIMVENVSVPQALAAKAQILAIDEVKSVIWLDDLTDIYVPLTLIPQELLQQYYVRGNALFQVEFMQSNYSPDTGLALEQIAEVLGEGVYIAGPAENSRHMRGVLASEIFTIMLVVVPICVIILMFASRSWVEPFLYLLVIGVSIVINMGTNLIFPSISFITHAMAAVLQLAISMDYSLFLCHRYSEERDSGKDAKSAVLAAAKNSFSSISASSLTTIAGFLALVFMQYRIGADIGFVLAKGILISFLCVMVLMPVLLYSLHGLIDKTRHRQFIPSFAKFGAIVHKLRYAIIALALIVVIPSFLAQGNNIYLYGDTSGSSADEDFASGRMRIEALFSTTNPIIILVPNDDISAEILLSQELADIPAVRRVTSLVTLADPTIPRDLLPLELKDNFLSRDYSRIVVDLADMGETPEMYAAVEQLKESAQKYYPGRWLAAGTATSVTDIKATVESDTIIVSLFSTVAVGLIILLTFRSLFIPVLLVTVIQASIWVNMGAPYFSGTSLVFIGFLVIKALQLGATIDYAILLSNRYMEFRRSWSPKESAIQALSAAGGSVLVSALILSVAGYAEGILSGVEAISAIGILLGRGAALSGLMVLTLLPVLLVVFDKVVMTTTLGTSAIQKIQKDRSV